MNTFIENLKKQAEKVVAERKPIAEPIETMRTPIDRMNPKPNFIIERVINKGEIRLYFREGFLRENITIWDRIKTNLSGEFSMIGKYWRIADNYDSQLFCDQYLGTDFLDVKEETVKEEKQETPSTPFDTYKQQCSELIAHLGCDVADLALKAVDSLHKQTFGRN